MTRCDYDDREKGIGLRTSGPERPDICFGRSVIFYSMCVCAWMLGYRCFQEGRKTHFCLFFSPHLCPQVDEWSTLVQVKLPPSTNSLRRSLLRRPDNGTVLQRSCLLCPILLWPPPAFVRIYHDISTDPNHHHQPSPSPPSLYGERLHLDHNEKFICTQQLMATLIWYRNISSRIFPPSCFHPQNLFKPLLIFASSTTPSWVVLNPSGPLGFLLCLK